jgi:uncharacterized OB-fold protein
MVQATWDLTKYTWKIQGLGLQTLLEGFKRAVFQGIRCPDCGTVYVPGPSYCRKCLIDIDEVVEVSDEGTVETFAVELADVRGNPVETPNISAMIKLDGADTWLIAVIREVADWHDVHVGMRVKAVWKSERAGSLADYEYFKPIS